MLAQRQGALSQRLCARGVTALEGRHGQPVQRVPEVDVVRTESLLEDFERFAVHRFRTVQFTDGPVQVNGIRKGFRLLKGAGGPDKDEPMNEVGSGDASGDGGNAMDDIEANEDTGAPDDWPANGPKLDGTTVRMPERNLEWTLPKDGPFQWAGAIEDVKAEAGQFVLDGRLRVP